MSTGKKLMLCFYAVAFFLAVILGRLFYTTGKDFDGDARTTALLEAEPVQEGNVLMWTKTLPEAFDSRISLLFESSQSEVEVLLDDETIYTYGMEERNWGKSPGSYWHVVDLPAGSAGKTLTIRHVIAYDSIRDNIPLIYYGSHGECVEAKILDMLPVLVLNCIIIFCGLISIFLHIQRMAKRKRSELGSLLCLGLFAILVAIWSLRQCGFLQLLIPNGGVLYFIDLQVLLLFPALIDLFIYTICGEKHKKGFAAFAGAYLLCVVAETVLQLLGVVDMFEVLFITHGLILVNVVYLFWAIYRESREAQLQGTEPDISGEAVIESEYGIRGGENGGLSQMKLPLCILVASGIMEMVSYYISILKEVSIFMALGTMIFILMLIWQQVQEYYNIALEEEKLAYFEKLARTDMLTGAFNRNAYEEALRALAESEDLNGQWAVVFDLNNMKVINDNFGHEKGDQAIKSCYGCIERTFGKLGDCYRIGGDEFVLLGKKGAELKDVAERFDAAIKKEAARLDFPFSVAFGCAIFNPEKDADFHETIHRCDALMYKDKKEKKINMNMLAQDGAL